MPQPISIQPVPSGPVLAIDGNMQTGSHMAARTSLRPIDLGILGSYSLTATTGTIAAGLGAIFVASFRWTDILRLCLVRRVQVSSAWVATAFTAGAVVMELLNARAYTVNDLAGGTLTTVAGNSAKRRSSHGNTLLGGLTVSTTGAISGGTKTVDANPIACIAKSLPAVGGAPVFDPADLWTNEAGKYPIVLSTMEGLLVRATAPATGTYNVTVTVEWDEVFTY